jgi:hypothetical protein
MEFVRVAALEQTGSLSRTSRLLAACLAALAVIGGAASALARTGLAPVTIESGLDRGLASRVESAALSALARTGIDPPSPRVLGRRFGPAKQGETVSTERCVDVGRDLGLDVVVALAVRRGPDDGVEVEIRVVVVETGDEYRFLVNATAAHVPVEVGRFLTRLFASVRAWEGDLVAVEQALGRSRDSAYQRFLRASGQGDASFAEWAYCEAERRRTASLVLGISIPVILAGATVGLGVATRGIWREDEGSLGGLLFTSVTYTRGWTALGLVVGTAGTLAAPLIAIWRYRTHEEDMRNLQPLLPDGAASPSAVSWSLAPSVYPGGAVLELTLRI